MNRRTLEECALLRDLVVAGKLTRLDFLEWAFGMTPSEAVDYEQRIERGE